ncbi:MAG: GMP synthase [Candidatus Omnitrophica bacterium CG12_big_fil_rev_8_21_14_0_65_50_5]|nr:MAG: GMP synthase [Candidatus Omnitrophica bacterium CG12_big_fil_rev_8_21_14_0_65_50_5]
MKILYIKNMSIEGPELIETFFEKNGLEGMTLDLSQGDKLIYDPREFDAVVVLGGPMNVYEEDKYPFLKKETEFIRNVVESEVPYLGVCLGSQLLAKACGAKVGQSPAAEIGFSNVRLTDDGKKDPLFDGLGKNFNVFQWHGDMFFIPKNGEWLATSDICPHQAMRVGECAYGLQFHFEVTDRNIREWAGEYFAGDPQAEQKIKKMMADYSRNEKSYLAMSKKICSNFAKIVQSRKLAGMGRKK